MLRLCGAGCILLSSLGLSAALAAQERGHLRALGAFCGLAEALVRNLETVRLPYRQVLAGFQDARFVPSGFSALLHTYAEDRNRKNPLGDAVHDGIQAGKLFLTGEEEALLQTFSAELGRAESAEELRRCSAFAGTLAARKQTAEAGAAARIRVRTVLPAAVGMLCILLLL